jgi:hypothetical protein
MLVTYAAIVNMGFFFLDRGPAQKELVDLADALRLLNGKGHSVA